MSQFTLDEWLQLVADLKTSQTEFNVGTASPIFHVQEEKKVYGLNSEYSDKSCWIDGEEGTEFDTALDYFNELDAEEERSFWDKIKEQMEDLLARILLLAATISFIIALLGDGDEGLAAYVEPFVILLILVLNASVAIYQDNDADSALEALKNM